MLLAFDVGNTDIVIGVFNKEKLIFHWRLNTDINKSADEYAIVIKQLLEYSGLSNKKIDGVVIASVLSSIANVLQDLSNRYFRAIPLIVNSNIDTGLVIWYDDTNSIEPDRIANCVAAYKIYGSPSIVIDFKTTTTICAITSKGEFIGGCIAPGIKWSLEVLCEKAAALPSIELRNPGKTICQSTIEGMQSGLINGHIGMIYYLIHRIKKEMEILTESSEKAIVIATGEMIEEIENELDCIDFVDEHLTLKGLQIIHKRNQMRL